MREKIALFCNLNEIPWVENYQWLSDYIVSHSYDACIPYNTKHFFVQWIWDLHIWVIDDEQFFQIGDVTSDRVVISQKPHLDAVDYILTHLMQNTLYVIDHAAQVAYTHVHWSRDVVEKKLAEQWSFIYVI